MFQKENYERLNVFSKLKKTRRMMRDVCVSRRVYVIYGSVCYLLLMDVFPLPSVLGGCARRRVSVRGSLVMRIMPIYIYD